MIILIVTILMLIVGIVIYNIFKNDPYSSKEDLGIALIIFGSFILAFEMIIIMCKPFDYRRFKVEYNTIKEMSTSSDDLRDATFTNKIIEINQQINYSREFRKNSFIGIFISHKIGDLELLSKEKENE